MSTKTAIIVGGGPAGASAAFRLQQAGVSVRLIERDDRVGGRTRTERIDGFVVDVGAGLLPGTYKAVYRLMAASHQLDQLAPMSSPTAVMRDGVLHYIELASMAKFLLKSKLIGMKSKLMLAKAAVKILSISGSLGFDDLSGAARYDIESIADYGKGTLTTELYDYMMNPMQKIMYVMPGSDASVIDYFWCSKNLMSPKAFYMRGGMDRVVANVVNKIPVTLSTIVTSVTEIADKVSVTFRPKGGEQVTEIVDFCVIATPAREVPRIDRGLPEAASRYLSTLKYSTLTDLHLRLKSRPNEKAVLIMVPDSVAPELGGILLDHNKGDDRAPSGKGAISAYFVDSWSRKATHWPDEEVYRQGMAMIERVMPGLAQTVEGYHVQRWDYAATLSYPGYYKELAAFIKELPLNRRVQLAGDYFSVASVNTAVTSGEIAAERLIKAYL